MPEWPIVRFEDLADGSKSAFSKPYGSAIMKEDYVPVGVPVVRGVNLRNGIFVDDNFVYISAEKANQMPGANLTSGDLVFTHRGTIGQVSMIPRDRKHERYVLSTSHVKARLNSHRALPEFYYYYFSSPLGQQEISKHISTVGVPGLVQPVATVKSFPVPHPPIEIQRAIAGILGALDGKIAVNDRIAATVDALLAAEFSAGMRGSGRIAKIGELVSFKYGKALKEGNRAPGKIPVFGGNGISGWHDTPLDPGPGIIIGRKGANAGSVSWSRGPFWAIDTSFYVESLSPGIPLEFLYFLLEEAGLRRHVGDSAIPGLNREIALNCTVQLPADDMIERFASDARYLLERKAETAEESRALAELRDSLLPRLMSGEIRVKDAEKVVEDVT